MVLPWVCSRSCPVAPHVLSPCKDLGTHRERKALSEGTWWLAVLGTAVEGDVDPNLRNAKDGSPVTTEGAKRPRSDERGPEAKPPGLWVRRQASEIGGTRGVHGVGAARCIHEQGV